MGREDRQKRLIKGDLRDENGAKKMRGKEGLLGGGEEGNQEKRWRKGDVRKMECRDEGG